MSSYEPAEAPRQYADLGNHRLRDGSMLENLTVGYVEHGPPDAGTTVLALSSLGGDAHRLDFLIGDGRAFDPATTRIIGVDALGNGHSSSPSTSRTQPGDEFPAFSVGDMVDTAALLLDQLEIDGPIVAAGASMGGMQALEWACRNPERTQAVVAMVPLARTPPWTRAATRLSRRLTTDGVAARRDWQDWSLLFSVLLVNDPLSLADVDDLDGFIDVRGTAAEAANRDPLDWRRQTEAYDAFDLGIGRAGGTEGALASISVPTLIGVAEHDLLNPTHDQRWIMDHIRDVRSFDLPGSGHFASNPTDPGARVLINRTISEFLAHDAD